MRTNRRKLGTLYFLLLGVLVNLSSCALTPKTEMTSQQVLNLVDELLEESDLSNFNYLAKKFNRDLKTYSPADYKFEEHGHEVTKRTVRFELVAKSDHIDDTFSDVISGRTILFSNKSYGLVALDLHIKVDRTCVQKNEFYSRYAKQLHRKISTAIPPTATYVLTRAKKNWLQATAFFDQSNCLRVLGLTQNIERPDE